MDKSFIGNKKEQGIFANLHFNEHQSCHSFTCFKTSSEHCSLFPMIACNRTYIFDNQHILNNPDFKVFKNDGQNYARLHFTIIIKNNTKNFSI